MPSPSITAAATEALAAKLAEGAAAAAPEAQHEARVAALREELIGEGLVFRGGVGVARRMLYTDYTASGRAVRGVEKFITDKVLPMYGNTHTLASSTARQTTFYRNEARQVVKSYFNCSHDDALIFAGAGATGAVHLLAALAKETKGFTAAPGVREETRWGSVRCTACDVTVKNDELFRAHVAGENHRRAAAAAAGPEYTGCWFLIDPTAHHSLCLPFREIAAAAPTYYTVGTLALDAARGCVCLADVEAQLAAAARQKVRVWLLLSAASNVTGAAPSRPALVKAARAHPHAVIGWDLAALAGHDRFDFAPHDFAFVSPHKLLGGPGAPGILLVKKRLLNHTTPCYPGGGVVHYVTADTHQYIAKLEEREEAGTPNIVGCIRAGLLYRLHALLHMPSVVATEQELTARLHDQLAAHPAVELLGNGFAPPFGDGAVARLPILSFNVRYNPTAAGKTSGGPLYLHHNFVTVVLNDLFGVQVRGGCACAGPYAQQLLRMTPAWTAAYEEVLTRTGLEVLRPGFVRTGVHFTMTAEQVDAVAAAVLWVAEHGWKLLGAYDYEVSTGEWAYRKENYNATRGWLSEWDIHPAPPPAAAAPSEAVPTTAAELRAAANAFLSTVYTNATGLTLNRIIDHDASLPADLAPFVFFARPKDFLHSVHAARGGAAGHVLKSFAGISPMVGDARGAGFGEGAVGGPPPAPESYLPGEGVAVPNLPPPPPPVAAGAPVEKYGQEAPQKRGREAAAIDAAPPAAAAAPSPKRQKKGKHAKLGPLMPIPKTLRSAVGEAVHEYGMISAGDKILVGVSGGKDSLCLLHVLLNMKRVSPVKFEVGAATVDPMTPEYDPSPMTAYLATLGIPYTILRQPIVTLAKEKLQRERRASICSFCSRMKRGLLYGHMRAEGYTTLALGQHLDDLAESFLMSLFRNGALNTMKACYVIDDGDGDGDEGSAGRSNHGLKVIRPFAHVRERVLARLAAEHELPVIADNCPACFAVPKERHNTKVLLSQLEAEQPTLFPSILKAMKPLIAVNTTDKKQPPQPKQRGGAGTAAAADQQAEEVTLPCNSGGACPV